MYKSPIEIMQTEMQVQMDNGVLKAVQDVGIHVDKAELLKALAYDRKQYQKGYADGRKAGHEWISVKDRLPLCGERVLISDGSSVFEAYLSISHKWVRSGIGWYEVVTHWMPLPEPPQGA